MSVNSINFEDKKIHKSNFYKNKKLDYKKRKYMISMLIKC